MGVCKQRATCYSMWVLISLPEERRDTSGITTERDCYTVCVGRKTSDKRNDRKGGKGRERNKKTLSSTVSIYLRTRDREKAHLLIIHMHNSECFLLSLARKSHSYLSFCICLASQLILILLSFCLFFF